MQSIEGLHKWTHQQMNCSIDVTWLFGFETGFSVATVIVILIYLLWLV